MATIGKEFDGVDIKVNIRPSRLMGWIAFIVSEVLVLLCLSVLLIGVINNDGIPDTNVLAATLTFQGTIFVTVFGAVATKNFKRR